MMTSLLSTVGHNNGLRTVKTTTSQAHMDSRYHQRYGYRQMPQILKIVSFLARAWPSCSLVIIRSLERGLYLHEVQELAKVMTKTTTWMGQPTHQMVFPVMIAEGR